MTSETQKKRSQLLFSQWAVLGEQAQLLGTFAESSFGYTSYQDFLKYRELKTRLIAQIYKLDNETTEFIYSSYYDRWKENGELE